MNKSLRQGMSILGMSKTAMFDYWYSYVKPKYIRVAKICHMDTDSCIVHIKTEDIYASLAEGVKKDHYP